MARDINKTTYKEATLTKLEIFEQYLVAWLPVFIQAPAIKNVMICDFFAGSGYDVQGVPGSPIRILQTIDKYRDQILQKNIQIHIVLNEALVNKYNALQDAVKKSFDTELWQQKVSIKCYNEEFQSLFRQLYDQLQKQPNLLFIDQYGVKEVNGEIFQMLLELDRTDFLFFLSSSFVKRFAARPEFKKHFPDLDSEMVSNAKLTDVHRIMLEYYERYKEKILPENKTMLFPFSLLKGGNIYGLVFGSKHLLGVEKFLDLAWNTNNINGEANFDIDEDLQKQKPTLFDGMPGYERQKTKHEVFEDELEKFIKKHSELTNRHIYNFTLNQGHPKKHAKECVMRLKKEGEINYKGHIGFSFNSCVKQPPKSIKVKKNG